MEKHQYKCPIPPTPKNEIERLETLRAYQLLDTLPEEAFDRITSLAARMFNVPICLVSLIDVDRQWFKSRHGLDAVQTPRRLAFCAYVIMEEGPDVLVVPSARDDPRFKDNDLVTGPPHIQFYAGAPLVLNDGLKLGSLCVIDTKPRTFGLEDKQRLVDLAATIVSQIQLRRELSVTHRSYIASTSHNLRTPLASLELCHDILSLNVNGKPEAIDALEQANANLEIMKWTVEKGLSTARSHFMLAPQVPEIKCFSVEAIKSKLHKAVAPFEVVPIKYHIEDCPEYITTDNTVIFHSLLDLITNANTHTKQGHIDVTFKGIDNNGKRYIRISVADTGTGVRDEVKPKLFSKPLINGDKIGLGCYGVRMNMELINGTYGYYENEDKGSTFWVQFPDVTNEKLSIQASINSPPANVPVPIESIPNSSKRYNSILVVDDCRTIRTMLQKVLQKEGYSRVDVAINGREGLQALKSYEYDLAIIDFLMPVMLGVECMNAYRKWEKENRATQTIIIGISANADQDDVSNAYKQGMNNYLNKPVSAKLLTEVLQEPLKTKSLSNPPISLPPTTDTQEKESTTTKTKESKETTETREYKESTVKPFYIQVKTNIIMCILCVFLGVIINRYIYP